MDKDEVFRIRNEGFVDGPEDFMDNPIDYFSQ